MMRLRALDGIRQAGLAIIVAAVGLAVGLIGTLLLILQGPLGALTLRTGMLLAGVTLLAFVFNGWDGVGWCCRRYRWWGAPVAFTVVLPLWPSEWLLWFTAAGYSIAAGVAAGVAYGAVRGRGVGRVQDGPQEARPSTLPEIPADLPQRVAAWTAHQLLAWRIHRGWDQRCREMGLDAGRRGATDRMVVPRLLPLSRGGVRVTDEAISIAFKPREDWEASDYAALSERLLGSFNGHSVRFEPFAPRVLGGRYLRFHIGRRPLPTRVPPPPVAPSGGKGWFLGDAAGGGQVRLYLNEGTPVHGLCIGGTGGGKTTSLRGLAQQAKADGWRVIVLDTKGTTVRSDYMDLAANGTIDLLIHDIDKAAQFLITLDDARADFGLDAVAGEAPPMLVICDEVRDYIGVHAGEHLDLRKQASAKVTTLATKGRSARVHLILAIQRSDVAELGQSGGFLRAQLMATWAVGDLDDDGYSMAFGKGAVTSTDKLLMNGRPGRGMAHKTHPAMGTDVVPFQAVHWASPPADEEAVKDLRKARKVGAAQRWADLLQSVNDPPPGGALEGEVITPPARLRVVPAPDGVGPSVARTPARDDVEVVPWDDGTPADAGEAETPAPPAELEAVAPGGEGGPVSVPDVPASEAQNPGRPSRYQQTLKLAHVLEVLAGDDRDWRRAEVAGALGRSSGDGSVGRRLEDGVKAGLIVAHGPKHARLYRAAASGAEGAASHGG